MPLCAAVLPHTLLLCCVTFRACSLVGSLPSIEQLGHSSSTSGVTSSSNNSSSNYAAYTTDWYLCFMFVLVLVCRQHVDGWSSAIPGCLAGMTVMVLDRDR